MKILTEKEHSRKMVIKRVIYKEQQNLTKFIVGYIKYEIPDKTLLQKLSKMIPKAIGVYFNE